MAYPSGAEPPSELPFDCPPGFKDVVIYNAAIHIHPNGHACLYLGRVDLGRRRFLSERLQCLGAVGTTRAEVLAALLEGVAEALSDARQD